MSDNDYTIIGRRIRENRKELGLTQQQLSSRSGVSMQHISNIENGRTQFSLKAVNRIKRVFEECGLYDPGLQVEEVEQKWMSDIYDIMSDCTIGERTFLVKMLQNTKELIRQSEDAAAVLGGKNHK